MIGVTIGIGEGWNECAHWAARRMEDMTGLPCRTFSHHDLPESDLHPSWWKQRILHLGMGVDLHDDILYFDADIIPLKPWNPQEIFEKNGRKICAVRDNNPVMRVMVEMEEQAIGIPKGSYLNAGLFMFGREHAPVFEATWARRPKWHNWVDQSAWNRALYDLKVAVAVLPNEYNCMSYNFTERNNSINWHCHSLDGNWRKLKMAQESIQARVDIVPPAPPVPTT